MAAVNADKKMASILIDAGADRSIKDNNGRTAKDRLRFFNFLLSEFF
jgi:ankyrin repeat protein